MSRPSPGLHAATVTLRFYAELNDFLPAERRGRRFTRHLPEPTSVKDLIEGLGVPHTEIDLILVDGESVDFARLIRGGESIAVYPLFEALDLRQQSRLRPVPLRALNPPRFVADVHLGTLARYLRLAGFDTVWHNDLDDPQLARISATEHRILLTRDRFLLQRRVVTHGIFIRDDDPRAQFRQVAQRLDLARLVRPWTRCSRCNGLLEAVDKAAVVDQLEPKTRLYYDDFRRCTGCGQIYWQGSHVAPLSALLDDLLP